MVKTVENRSNSIVSVEIANQTRRYDFSGAENHFQNVTLDKLLRYCCVNGIAVEKRVFRDAVHEVAREFGMSESRVRAINTEVNSVLKAVWCDQRAFKEHAFNKTIINILHQYCRLDDLIQDRGDKVARIRNPPSVMEAALQLFVPDSNSASRNETPRIDLKQILTFLVRTQNAGGAAVPYEKILPDSFYSNGDRSSASYAYKACCDRLGVDHNIKENLASPEAQHAYVKLRQILSELAAEYAALLNIKYEGQSERLGGICYGATAAYLAPAVLSVGESFVNANKELDFYPERVHVGELTLRGFSSSTYDESFNPPIFMVLTDEPSSMPSIGGISRNERIIKSNGVWLFGPAEGVDNFSIGDFERDARRFLILPNTTARWAAEVARELGKQSRYLRLDTVDEMVAAARAGIGLLALPKVAAYWLGWFEDYGARAPAGLELYPDEIESLVSFGCYSPFMESELSSKESGEFHWNFTQELADWMGADLFDGEPLN